jgi:hypothetical protein
MLFHNQLFFHIQGVPEVLDGLERPYLRSPWDDRNGIGTKRCVLSSSFVSKIKKNDYLNFPMSYGRYTKNSDFAFFCASEIVLCL